MRVAVVLFNLGGPDSPEAVEPFLRNLFSDPAIITLPAIVRLPLARLIARRRAPVAREIYAHMGGRSPIVEETRTQARALEAALAAGGMEAKTFIAMRYWHPFSDGAALAVKNYAPDRIVLLPLYPQFSTTTTASSLKDWTRTARKAGLNVPTGEIVCYPREPGFITAMAARIREALGDASPEGWRLLLSAHGLPKKIIQAGDPYQWQVEQSAEAIVDALGIKNLDWQVCYQSRVGPMEWIGPATDAEIRRAGAEGKNLIVAPLAFVSEHSETLVELDIEYGRLARESGVPQYRRARTVGDHPDFIAGLAGLVRQAALEETGPRMAGACPARFARCGCAGR
ncbi:MAG: ferrochelatase [Alphaproteobacteria bacterium 64-11]|nr:ferrochelatase [Alphaproteobacteria bacterium]OJU10913.1 MAG: ferrochelatase [Alphaproteobacteria bacterium 64-11]